MCIYSNVFLIIKVICTYYLKKKTTNTIAIYYVESEIPTQIVMSI